jgi:hypothetical protein
MFTYTASGSLRFAGCTSSAACTFLLVKFKEGSFVYLCEKAQKGILERLAIRRVKCTEIKGQIIALYFDTFNAVYNEEELCTHSEAVAKAKEFHLSQISGVQKLLDKVCR